MADVVLGCDWVRTELTGGTSKTVMIGDIAADCLFCFRVVHLLQEDYGYFGPSVLAHTLSCPSLKLESRFPPPGGCGDYDVEDGIRVPTERSRDHPPRSCIVREIEWSDLRGPESLVAEVLLAHLREAWGARVDYARLLDAVNRLSRDSLTSGWGHRF